MESMLITDIIAALIVIAMFKEYVPKYNNQEITKENMAKQQKAVHEIELLMNIYQQKHITNN